MTSPTTAPAKVKVGDYLENRAIVLATKPARDRGAIVVLALNGGEFVTWIAREDGSNTFWGHYFFADIAAAVADFQGRS